MPINNGDMKHRNGALVQHSTKWSDENRRKNSYNAGAGSRGSRNQGLGQQGINNTKTDTVVDTTKMNPDEKLKYFNSLNLLGPKSKAPPEAAPHKPIPQDTKSLVSTLQEHWKDAFNGDTRHAKRLLSELKDVAPAKVKAALQAAYRATAEITASESDPSAIVEYISNAITPYTYDE